MPHVERWLCLVGLVALIATPAVGQQTGPSPAEPGLRAVRLEGTAPLIFRQLGRLYGVPIEVEPDFPPRRVRVQLEPVDLTTALRVSTQLAGAFWVMQRDGSILVVQNTPDKRNRYTPVTLQTFVLPGLSAEEITEALRLLGNLLEMRNVRPDLRSQTLTIRDTPRRLAIAAELLEQFQAERGEVLLEVLLLEVDGNRARQLGILPPDQAVLVHVGAGILPTDNVQAFLQAVQDLVRQGVLPEALLSDRFDFTQGVGFAGVGSGRSAYLLNLSGATLSLSDIVRTTRSLRRITLRAQSGEEAVFFSGELFPIAFTTFSSIFIPQAVQDLIDQGLFVPPVPAIRQEELGLKLTVRPSIHAGGEISLEVEISQKTLTGQEVNGIPVLRNREIQQAVRLGRGEALLLSGLRAQESIRTRTGLPLLRSIPLLGRLFRRDSTQTRDTEFLLLFTAHVLLPPLQERLARYPLYLGTEQEFSPQRGAGSAAPIMDAPPRPPTPPPAPPPPPQRPPP